MAFPDSFVPDEIATAAASELIAYLHDAPLSAPLRAWTEALRADCDIARANIPLFGTHGGVEVGDDWMSL